MLAHACQLLQYYCFLRMVSIKNVKSINLQKNKRYLQYCPFLICLLSLWSVQINQKNRRFLKGLVTSQNVGYLFYFFSRMEGCREEKNFCEFEQRLVFKNIYTSFLIGENHLPDKRFFLPKPIVYILINIGHNSKRQTFFSMDQKIPAKRLSFFFFRFFFLWFHRYFLWYFSRQKTWVFLAAFLCFFVKTFLVKLFPPKDFFKLVVGPFKSANNTSLGVIVHMHEYLYTSGIFA